MKRKTNKDKGFTLVELIVVLVILAILAAILVPALLGYIDRAKEKQYVLNAKSALTATQAELSSIYGESPTKPLETLGKRKTTIDNTADVPGKFYIKTTLKDDGSTPATAANHAAYTVKDAIYVENDYYIVYNGTTWTTYQKTELPNTISVTDDGISGYTLVFD